MEQILYLDVISPVEEVEYNIPKVEAGDKRVRKVRQAVENPGCVSYISEGKTVWVLEILCAVMLYPEQGKMLANCHYFRSLI